MEELSGRFREVHVTFEHEAAPPRRTPLEWVQVRATGNVLSFVDTRFSQEMLANQIDAVAGVPQRIDAQPMALRSIFTTLARAARDGLARNSCAAGSGARAQDAGGD
jgi:hypothetical protein